MMRVCTSPRGRQRLRLRPQRTPASRFRPTKRLGSSVAQRFPDPSLAPPPRPPAPPGAHGSPRPQMQVAQGRCPMTQAVLRALCRRGQGRTLASSPTGLRVARASTCGRSGRSGAASGTGSSRDHQLLVSDPRPPVPRRPPPEPTGHPGIRCKWPSATPGATNRLIRRRREASSEELSRR